MDQYCRLWRNVAMVVAIERQMPLKCIEMQMPLISVVKHIPVIYCIGISLGEKFNNQVSLQYTFGSSHHS